MDAARCYCVVITCLHNAVALVLAIGINGDLCPPLYNQWDQVFGKNDRLLASEFIWRIHIQSPLPVGQISKHTSIGS